MKRLTRQCIYSVQETNIGKVILSVHTLGWAGTILGGNGGQLSYQDVQTIISASQQPQTLLGKIWKGFIDLFRSKSGSLGQGSTGVGPILSYSPTFGFSQSTIGSPGGFPEFGPLGWDALGGTYDPGVLGDLGLGGGVGFPNIKWQ